MCETSSSRILLQCVQHTKQWSYVNTTENLQTGRCKRLTSAHGDQDRWRMLSTTCNLIISFRTKWYEMMKTRICGNAFVMNFHDELVTFHNVVTNYSFRKWAYMCMHHFRFSSRQLIYITFDMYSSVVHPNCCTSASTEQWCDAFNGKCTIAFFISERYFLLRLEWNVNFPIIRRMIKNWR